MTMITTYIDFAHTLADTSTTILSDAFRQPASQATLKDDLSPVTQADKAVEACLREMIMEAYPEHGIIGEEFGNHQPDAPYQWILDPIDGTRAFACGHHSFGTLIGLMHEGKMLLGMLNQPITGERWAGVRGEATRYQSVIPAKAGIHCTTKQEPTWIPDQVRNDDALDIRTSTTHILAQARLATTSPYLFSADEKPLFESLMQQCAILQCGGDCINYGLLASGHIDIVMEAGLKPYDILPLLPILEGAGAVITDWHGAPLELSAKQLNILVSANQPLQKAALAVINAA